MKHERNSTAYALFGISLILVISVGLIIQSVNLFFGLAVTELLLILLPAIIFARRANQSVAKALRWHLVDPVTTLLCLFAGVGLWGMAAGLDQLIKYFSGINRPAEEGEFQLGSWLLMLVVFAVLPAICEESLFRGAIQGTLRRSGAKRAIIVTTLLFAVFHLNPVSLLPLIILGLVFGVVCWRTNSSFTAMLVHFANNAVAVSMPVLIDPDRQIWIMAGCAAIATIAFPLLWKRTATMPKETPVLATVDASMSFRSLIFTIFSGVFGFAIWLATLIVAGVYLILPLNMPDDSLEPDIGDNDRLIILRNDYFQPEMNPGDFVAVEFDDNTTVKRVVAVDGDTVRIKDNLTEMTIDASQIRGKLIHNFKRPASDRSRKGPN